MSKLIYLCLLLVALMSSHKSYAQWSPKARQMILKQARAKKFKSPAGLVSMWGGIKRTWASGDLKGETKEVHFKDLHLSPLEYYLYENKNKADLSVFFPGIFGHIDGSLSPEFVENLESLSTHVLVIPNLLSETYLKAKPKYIGDPTITDINLASKLIIKTFDELKNTKGKTIHLFAESLGTIVASGVLNKLLESKKLKDISFNLILFAPPLELDKAVENFDTKLKKTKKTYEQCSYWYRYPLVFYHFVWQEIPKEMDARFIECMDSYLYHGIFKRGMEQTLEASYDIKKIDETVLVDTFKDYFSKLNKKFSQMIKDKDPKLHLQYWLNRVSSQRVNIRIISAEDDFLNTDLSWNKFKKETKLKDENILLLNWGGHSGFLSFEDWPEVFKHEFFSEKK